MTNTQPGFSSIEFKILDSKLLDVIKNHKGDFIVIDILLNGKLKVLSKEI
jgi:hypothetical protein